MFVLTNFNEKKEQDDDEEHEDEQLIIPTADSEQNREREAMNNYLEQEKQKTQYERYLELVEKESTSLASKFKIPIMQPQKIDDSVNWGMIDEGEIYNDKGDYNTIINTRVLRMLPNLTEKQVQKIEAFEKKLKRIENMQKDFNRALEQYEQVSKGQSFKTTNYEEEQAPTAKNPQALLELKNGLEKKLEKFAAELEVDENKLKTMFGFPADDESERYRKAGITMRSMARKEVYSDEEDEYFDRTLVKEDRVFDKEERTKKLQKAAEQYSFSDLRMKLDDLVHLKSHMTRELLDLNMGKLRRKNQDDLDAVLEEANEDLVREKKVELINALKKNLVDIEETGIMLRHIKSDFSMENYQKIHEQNQQKKEYEKTQMHPGSKHKSRHEILNMLNQKNLELESAKGIMGRQIEQITKDRENEEEYDIFDEEDELKMLGKRWKQMHEQTLEAENASKVGPSKMKFGVTAKPVSRDADEEDVMDQETPTELVDFSEITSKVAHPQHEQMLDRQKNSGY